jgi:hypothetical protein
MEDQFLRMLAPTVGGVAKNDVNDANSFIASKHFDGKRLGYVFRNGQMGLGYYIDLKMNGSSFSHDDSSSTKKRKWDKSM